MSAQLKEIITNNIAILYQKLEWARKNGARETTQFILGQISGYSDCIKLFYDKELADKIIDSAIELSVTGVYGYETI